jgi:hypothetical protein
MPVHVPLQALPSAESAKEKAPRSFDWVHVPSSRFPETEPWIVPNEWLYVPVTFMPDWLNVISAEPPVPPVHDVCHLPAHVFSAADDGVLGTQTNATIMNAASPSHLRTASDHSPVQAVSPLSERYDVALTPMKSRTRHSKHCGSTVLLPLRRSTVDGALELGEHALDAL